MSEQTLEQRCRAFMETGLTDQDPKWFKDGDVNVGAMWMDTVMEFHLEEPDVSRAHAWAQDMKQWWDGLGIEYMGTTETEYFAAQGRMDERRQAYTRPNGDRVYWHDGMIEIGGGSMRATWSIAPNVRSSIIKKLWREHLMRQMEPEGKRIPIIRFEEGEDNNDLEQ